MSPTNNTGTAWEVNDSDQDLDRKAAMAKKDAQAKRKQIPPFVLKLWSFLNESKNTDLIRWTDDGTAFTVLDEDEFARTLIPELFKHNNYASFVRQLNMYGFHKKVGLNANSMKAAEKKTKDPNVYWHEYFRQGRDDLLWLIQKPQTKSATNKRKRGQDQKEHGGESDDEKRASPEAPDSAVGQIRQSTQDVAPLPKSEVASMRQEIQRLQRQQSVISNIITKLKDQNEQFYRQASEFQSMHERHENSINAILTFLATFYNRSMEAGVNLNNMFGNPQSQQHGSVVDVGDGDFADHNAAPTNQQLQRYRRPQLLLEGSPARDTSLQPGGVHTQPNSARTSTSPPSLDPNSNPQQRRNVSLGAQSRGASSQRTSNSPMIKEDVSTPPNNTANLLPPQFGENDDMISLINAANANSPSGNSPQFDFSRALNHAQHANGAAPLTTQQRTEMLNLIAAQQSNTANNNNNGPGTAPGQAPPNSALSNPTPPPMPDLSQYARTQEQLEMLTRLQREQDSKVADLAGRLQPLSPTGSIPGLQDGYGGGAGQLGGGIGGGLGPGVGEGDGDVDGDGDFDIDAFINSGDGGYFQSFGGEGGAGTGTGTGGTGTGGEGLGLGVAGSGAGVGGGFGVGDNDPTGLDFDFGNAEGGDDLFGDVGATGTAGGGSGIQNQQNQYQAGNTGQERDQYQRGRVESLPSGSDGGATTGEDEETPSKRLKTA